MKLDEFYALKKKVDKLKEDRAKSAGALDQLMTELEEKFGCGTIAQAKKLLKKLEQEEKDAAEEYEEALEEFKEKWEDKL